MSLPVAILAGGLATRLGRSRKRFLRRLSKWPASLSSSASCEYLRGQRAATVVLCIGHLGDMIEAVVGDGSRFGLPS